MVAGVAEHGGIRHHSEYIEQDLDRIGATACLPNALYQSGGAPNDQRLGKAQLHDAKKDEEEIH